MYINFYFFFIIFLLYLSFGVELVAMRTEELEKIGNDYTNSLSILATVWSQDEIDQAVAEYVSKWASILTAMGILCALVAVASIFIAINSFGLSRKYQFYHLSN